MTPLRARRADLAATAAVLAAIVALHLFALFDGLVADDHFFAAALDRASLGDYLAFRYRQWSGRLAIEALLVLAIEPLWLWKTLNAAMLWLLCRSAARLACAGDDGAVPQATLFALCLFLLLPADVQYTAAWWRTGAINYLWPTAAGLYGLLALVDRIGNSAPRRLACLLASGFAMHNEQLALALLPVACWLAWHAAPGRRGERAWDAAQLGFMAANAALVFLAPGSRARYAVEEGLRFPDFGALDLVDKLSLGLELVQRAVLSPSQTLTPAVVLLALALLWRSPAGIATRAVLTGVLALAIAAPVLHLLSPTGFAALQPYLDPAPTGGLAASSSRVYAAHAWLGFVVFALVIACALALARSRTAAMRTAAVLALGLGTVLALGFSPTAYASGVRVFFVADIAFLLVALRMILALREQAPAWRQALVLAPIGLFAAYRFCVAVF